MPRPKSVSVFLCILLLACGEASTGEPGKETGPCVDAQCLGDALVCLSDLCVDPLATPTGSEGGSQSGADSNADSGTIANSREVDILFVIDNTGTMGEEQGRLAARIPDFIGALDEAEADYRIGVTTTDMGNPWCGSTSPEAGKLQLSSCRSRLGEFVFNGNPPADATAAACTDVCETDSLSIADTTTELDATPRARPWIESGTAGTNVVGLDVDEALQCALPQGLAGCGFESPLEAMHRALVRAADPDDPQAGFLRSTAMLAVIIVTDEVDCSAADDSIFLPPDEGGNQAFWSDPDSGAPTSAVCWNAGVACEGSGTPYDNCAPSNRDVTGAYDVPDDEAVLHPVSRYLDRLASIEQERQAIMPAQEVLVALIDGVPTGRDLVYSNSLDPVFQGNFGVGPGCYLDDGISSTFALPPVRERVVAETFRVGDTPELHSICVDDFSDALDTIALTITGQLGASG